MAMVIFYALMSALSYGAADFMGGLSSRKSPAVQVVAWSHCAGFIVSLIAAPLLGFSQVQPADILWGMAAGISGAAGVTFLYKGLARGYASIISPAAAVSGAVIPVFFGLLFGERPHYIAWIGVAAAIPAILLLSLERQEQKEHSFRSLIMGLWAGIAFSGFFILISRTHVESGLWPLAAARATTIPLFFILNRIQGHSFYPDRKNMKFIILSGTLDMMANILFLLAARTGFMIIAVILTALYPAPTVFLQRIVFKEPLTWFRITGLVFAIAGAALIGIGS